VWPWESVITIEIGGTKSVGASTRTIGIPVAGPFEGFAFLGRLALQNSPAGLGHQRGDAQERDGDGE
jgi:hypothetical protein